MASNFNDDVVSQAGPGTAAASADDPAAPSPAPPAADPAGAPASAGVTRFTTCRWQQPKEEGTPAFCTHREVKPYAGTASFDPEAWCPDCVHYKLRRSPKKRSPEDYGY